MPKLIKGSLTLRLVSEATGYSVGHIWQLSQKYKKVGPECFVNQNKFRTPKNKISVKKREEIARIYMKNYDGYNFSFFKEILEEDFGIKISYRTLYNILSEAGIKSPEKHKVKKVEIHHRSRPRKAHEGEMLQIDGTPYQWFKWAGDNKYYCIQAGVDDATSKIVALYMTENECLYGYMEMLRQCYEKQGSPLSIYSDRAGIFCVTPRNKDKLSIAEQLAGLHEHRTQWQRILDEMHIKQILAWSPQAKGRVERMWRTVQSRLPHYFKKYKIKTMAEANIFLEHQFVAIYNKKFAKKAKNEEPLYFKYTEGKNINDILCARFPCKTNANGEFLFRRSKFAVIGAKYCACKNIELCINEQEVKALLNGSYYNVKLLDDLTDGRDELIPKVMRNIIYDALLRDMKKDCA